MMQDDLLFSAFIYLAVAVMALPLAKRMGLSSILGYLCAGIIIGPYVLGLTGDDTHKVMHFAEFGVVLMLFLIGLELQPRILWRLRRKIVGLGSLQLLGTAALITPLAYYLGTAWHLTWLQALAIGLVLALSSTAIVMQSLQEKGWRAAPGGKAGFAVLLYQDIAVIPILAILPLLAIGAGLADGAHGASDAAGHAAEQRLLQALPAWAQAGVALLTIALVILAGRYVLRPLFRAIAGLRSHELFTAFALFLVVAIALLMREIGLSMALGTFLAGVILAESEYRHELENTIEPFKGLLLGLFFISVGASIDFGLVFQHAVVVLSITFGLMLLKGLVLGAAGHSFNLKGTQLLLFALALAQGGEFAFVLFGYAVQQSVLPEQLVQILIAAVTLSMMATPLILLIYERFLHPQFFRNQADSDDEAFPEESKKVILAGYGAFGTLVGRMLAVNGFHCTILDHNPEQISRMRKHGFPVFYGDARRLELLERAGIAEADLLIVAFGDRDAAVRITQRVREHYPNVTIIARAADRFHYRDLKAAGAHVIIRQYLGSAIALGAEALKVLGLPSSVANRRALIFRKHDIELLDRVIDRELAEGKASSLAQRVPEEIERALFDDTALEAKMRAQGMTKTEH